MQSDAATRRADRPRRAAAHFRIPGELVSVERHGSGHIHETFVTTHGDGPRRVRHVLQKLNTGIFRDPEALMRNLLRVTGHLRGKLVREGAPDLARRCLCVVPTREGRPLYRDAEGDCWRALLAIEGARTHDVVAGPAEAREAARAFGSFLAALADLPSPPLAVTLPAFHDLGERQARLERALRADAAGRSRAVRPERERCRAFYERLRAELRRAGAEELPERPVHNDCKLNNVLIDERTGEALCVIDLDTVMEGSALSDFGELVRTATCPSPEDEVRLETMRLDLGLFQAVADGFLAGTGALLSEAEIAALHLAGPLMALENAIRFLTDHVEGDRYFRILRERQNLDRSRAQLRLVELLFQAEDELRRAVDRAAGPS